MHLHEYTELCEKRGLRVTARWLLEYSLATNVKPEGGFSVKSPEFMLAKSLFDSQEFERLLATFGSLGNSSVDMVSLCLLSELLLVQKRYPGISSESGDLEKSVLLKKAELVYSRFSHDSIINYVYALILGQCEKDSCEDLMADLLLKSIRLENWNWAAWSELAKLPSTKSSVVDDTLGPLYEFYLLEKLKNGKKFKALLHALESTKCSDKFLYLIQLRGQCYHELRLFDKAVHEFEKLAERDPFRLDGMDTYSNCLFVLEREEHLAQLAHHWTQISPSTFETCIIAGNYFSLKAEHEKAAVFFKRATNFDPLSNNALLLLGHELVELRNPSAALAVYQQAINLAPPNDSRPFYAIGQLFELINQFAFAVYYFEKASQIDKVDPRIWTALASCYQKLNRPDQAKYCSSRLKQISI